MSAVVVCPVCGGSVNAGAARCPQCGAGHRLSPSEARAEVEQRYGQWTGVVPASPTGSRGSPPRTLAALVIGLVYVALVGVALVDPAGDGLGARALGVLLLAPLVGVLQLLLLFTGRREGRRPARERVALVVSCVIAAACLAWGAFVLWFLILLTNADYEWSGTVANPMLW